MASSVEMTPQRWEATSGYLTRVFGRPDALLEDLAKDARAHGLPDIGISSDVGRVLKLLASTTGGRTAIEVGTLGGGSAIWILRGLLETGRLITIEADPKHADFADRWLAKAGLAHRAEVRRGKALEVLPDLARTLAPGSVDFAFIDAEKTEYVDYFGHLRGLIAPRGMLVADNVLGSSRWWIDQVEHPQAQAVDRFNRVVAEDAAFEVVGLPIRQGLLVARRNQ